MAKTGRSSIPCSSASISVASRCGRLIRRISSPRTDRPCTARTSVRTSFNWNINSIMCHVSFMQLAYITRKRRKRDTWNRMLKLNDNQQSNCARLKIDQIIVLSNEELFFILACFATATALLPQFVFNIISIIFSTMQWTKPNFGEQYRHGIRGSTCINNSYLLWTFPEPSGFSAQMPCWRNDVVRLLIHLVALFDGGFLNFSKCVHSGSTVAKWSET